MILYQPKPMNVLCATNRIKILIIKYELKNAVINPTINTGKSFLLKILMFETKSKIEAAKIIGIAKKKENSVAVFLSRPAISPPIIVEAALDTPGIKAKHCARPIIKDCR